MANKLNRSQKFGQWIVNKPWMALGIGLLMLVSLGVGLGRLTQDFSYRVWFPEDNPHLQAFDAFERKFGSDDVVVMGIYSDDGILDENSAKMLVELTNDLWQITEVIRVDSLSNFNWVHGEGDDILVEPFIGSSDNLNESFLAQRREVAIRHKNIKGYLISDDLKTSLIYLNLKPSLDSKLDYEAVNHELRALVAKYKNSPEYSSHEIYVTGAPALTFAFQESSQEDMKNLIPLVFLITLVFLTLFFKSLLGTLLPLLVIFPSIVATMGFSGWVGIEINVMTSIVPQFLIALSMAVIVHILASYFSFYRKGLSRDEAIALSVEKNLAPTLLTSISTAIGFLSFSTSSLMPLAEMGILAGVGTLFAWIFSYLVALPILKFVPQKRSENKNLTLSDILQPSPISFQITDTIIKAKYFIILVFVSLALTSIYFAMKTRVSSDPYKYFDKTYPLSLANDFVEKHVGGTVAIETVIESGKKEGIKDPEFLNRALQYQNWLEGQKVITKTVSIIDILREMNQTLNGGDPNQYKLAESQDLISQQLFLYTMNLPQGMDINNRVTIENDAIRLTSMSFEHDSERFLGFIDEMEKKGKEMGLNLWVTGKGRLYQSNNELVVKSFLVSVCLAIFLVGILMLIGLGSVKIGLLSIIPNAAPLVIGSGFVYLYGATLDIGSAVVGSVCLGIAVDDTIHFLANYQKFRDSGDDPRISIAKVFTNTVPALITTTVVLVAAFGCFVFASFVPNQKFGIFVAFILMVALVADLLLLPAILLLMDKKK